MLIEHAELTGVLWFARKNNRPSRSLWRHYPVRLESIFSTCCGIDCAAWPCPALFASRQGDIQPTLLKITTLAPELHSVNDWPSRVDDDRSTGIMRTLIIAKENHLSGWTNFPVISDVHCRLKVWDRIKWMSSKIIVTRLMEGIERKLFFWLVLLYFDEDIYCLFASRCYEIVYRLLWKKSFF